MCTEKTARYNLGIKSLEELINQDNENQVLKPIVLYLKEQKRKIQNIDPLQIKVNHFEEIKE